MSNYLSAAPLAWIPIVIAGAVVRAEREVVNRLKQAGATSSQTAIPLEDLRGLARKRLRRLVSANVVQEGRGRYHLDLAAWEAGEQHKRKIALVAVILGVVLFVLISYWP